MTITQPRGECIMKRFISMVTVMLMLFSFTAYAERDPEAGFEESPGYTETANEYYFHSGKSVVVYNKEATLDPYYDEVFAGSDIYLPIYVYEDGSGTPKLASEKLIKTDDVDFSSKVMLGGQHIGEITMVDTKKLKIKGLEAGMYVHIPVPNTFTSFGSSIVRINFVLSVNGVTYQNTITTFKGHIKNHRVDIKRNSVYGAKSPTQFEVNPKYEGEVTFDFGGNVKYTVDVKPRKIYYLNLSREEDEAISEMYPETHLEFYNFLGDRDTFSSTGKLEIPVKKDSFAVSEDGPSELYAYKINGSQLTALGKGDVAFDIKSSKLIMHTHKLEKYVLSNKPLMKDVQSGATNENILRSGYASATSAAAEEISDTGEAGAANAAGSSAQPASQAARDTANTAAQQNTGTGAAEDENGYVPEEYTNDNMSMGLPINADNASTDNPQTSDFPLLLSVSFAGMICGAAVLMRMKKR